LKKDPFTHRTDSRRFPWRKPSNAVDGAAPQRSFRVTHPFHPLTGRTFEVISVHQTWGEYRVFYAADDGALAAMPVNWTDVAEPDPFVAIGGGRAYCRLSDLLRLCAVIAEAGR
jgi:hypothetical protein